MKSPRLVLCSAVAFAAVIAYFLPEFLAFKRDAVLSGQWWRLLSCNWVHFSPLHLLGNMAVALPSIWILGKQSWIKTALLIMIAGITISLGLLWLEPDLTLYGGFSGIAIALLARIGFLWINDPSMRLGGCLMIGLLVAKVFFADSAGQGIIPLNPDFVTVQLSHIVGLLIGAIAGLAEWLKQPQFG